MTTDEEQLATYTRVFNMAKLALMAIGVYGTINHEQWLGDHGWGVIVDRWRANCEHYEYLRRMDTEIAQTALYEIDTVLRERGSKHQDDLVGEAFVLLIQIASDENSEYRTQAQSIVGRIL